MDLVATRPRRICSPLRGISGAIQPDVRYGLDTYARQVYWMAEDGKLRSPEDLEYLESRLMLPDWYNTINDKLTENNYYFAEFKDQVQLVVCLGDKDLFFETFFKGKFDLDAIRNELDEKDEDIRIEMRERGDIEDAFNQEAHRMEALRLRAAEGDGELPISIYFSQEHRYIDSFVGRGIARLCGFGEGRILHAGLDVGGLRVEWGVGPCSPSLVYPRCSARAILAKIMVPKKSLFQRFIEAILDPISTLIKGFFLYFLGYANNTSLYKIADVCTTYNRSKVWNPLGCNCQKFVLEVLDRLNLRFAPEGEMKAFIDRINQGDYNLSITDPNGRQTVFKSVRDLDEFAEVHWRVLPPWSKYLLCTYNSICSERASDAAATTDSPWVRSALNRDEAHQVWSSRVHEVHRLVKN